MALEQRAHATAACSVVNIAAGTSGLANRVQKRLDPFNVYGLYATVFALCA
jgi:hypothetical protein